MLLFKLPCVKALIGDVGISFAQRRNNLKKFKAIERTITMLHKLRHYLKAA